MLHGEDRQTEVLRRSSGRHSSISLERWWASSPWADQYQWLSSSALCLQVWWWDQPWRIRPFGKTGEVINRFIVADSYRLLQLLCQPSNQDPFVGDLDLHAPTVCTSNVRWEEWWGASVNWSTPANPLSPAARCSMALRRRRVGSNPPPTLSPSTEELATSRMQYFECKQMQTGMQR